MRVQRSAHLVVFEDKERLTESESNVSSRDDGVKSSVADDPIEGALEYLGDVETIVNHAANTETCDRKNNRTLINHTTLTYYNYMTHVE